MENIFLSLGSIFFGLKILEMIFALIITIGTFLFVGVVIFFVNKEETQKRKSERK